MSRPRLRYVVVGVAVALLLLIQLFGVIVSGVSAENTALSVARDSIGREGDTTIESILRHLEPAEQSANVTARLLADNLLEVTEPELERYLYTQLAVMPQMTGAFVGFVDGSFVFVSRDGDGFRSKRIRMDGARSVLVRHFDQTFTQVDEERPADDTYDPRERPWYGLAAASTDLEWTDPYVFFSSGNPGVTASRAVRGADDVLTAVVGVDVELSGLTEFIDHLSVSENGEAFVVSGDDVVAAPSRFESQSFVADDGSLRLLTVAEIGIGDLVSAGSAPSVGDVGVLEGDGDNQLVLAVPFPVTQGLDWAMVISAPQSDFTEAVRQQRHTLMLFWVVGIALVAASALVLVRVTRPLQALHNLATTDPLTGLANRRRLAEEGARMVSAVERSGGLLSVLVIDLDDFKSLNDVHGHAAGDRALTMVGARLAELVADGDLVGRLGGDEFVVVQRVGTEAEAIVEGRSVLDALTAALRSAFPDLGGLGASAGLCVSTEPTDHGDHMAFDDMVSRADAALIEQKGTAKGAVGLVVLGAAPAVAG